MKEIPIVERLTEPQRRAIMHLTDDPQRAVRGGPWHPNAAFRLVMPGFVRLHQEYTGDRYSLTKRGLALKAALSRAQVQP